MKRSEIEAFLPDIIQQALYPNSPLAALLDAMETLHEPAESVLQDLDAYFDYHRTPDDFVPFLSRWLNFERLFESSALMPGAKTLSRSPLSSGLPALRELIAIAAYLSRWRGTARGLILFLETATDTRGFEVIEKVTDNNERILPFHLEIRAPETTMLHQALIERIIESEKPAYVTYDLEFYSIPRE